MEFRKKRHSIDEFSEVSRQNRGGYKDATTETIKAVKDEQLEKNLNSEKREIR